MLFRAFPLSLSLFQFDGDSAYGGMSDGNPELLSASQVGAPSFLSVSVGGGSSLGLAGAKLLLGSVWEGCRVGHTAHHCPFSE